VPCKSLLVGSCHNTHTTQITPVIYCSKLWGFPAAETGEAAAGQQQGRVHRQPRQQQQPQQVSQLSITGVSLAVMSRRQGLAASPVAAAAQQSPAVSSSEQKCEGRAGPSTAASDLAAVLAAEGWRECHVLLRQWQCTITLCAAQRARKGSKAAAQAASPNDTSSVQDQQTPAIIVQYETAGMAEVCRRCRGWPGGGCLC